MKYDPKRAIEDLEDYTNATLRNDIDTCLAIENWYGLDGYPPMIVVHGLQAVIDGKDLNKAIDELLGSPEQVLDDLQASDFNPHEDD
jgi:hypothetical protein